MVSFNGIHNSNRSKVLIVLYDRYEGNKPRGLTVRELAEQTGCNFYSLKSRVMKWVKWKYLLGYRTTPYTFKIAERGRKWLDRHRNRGMPFDRYMQEIEQWQQRQKLDL